MARETMDVPSDRGPGEVPAGGVPVDDPGGDPLDLRSAIGPVTVAFREVSRNPRHVRVQMFVGRNEGARGNSGEVVLRTDEWDEIRAKIELPFIQDTGEVLGLDDVFEILPPIEIDRELIDG